MKLTTEMSDVKMSLTQRQYMLLMAIANSLPKALSGVSDTDAFNESMPVTPVDGSLPDTPTSEKTPSESGVNLEPELAVSKNADDMWTTLSFVFSVSSIALELHGPDAIAESELKKNSIARFALVKTHVGFKQLSDGASEADFSLKALAFSSTRSANSVFRDIIPAAEHDGNQM